MESLQALARSWRKFRQNLLSQTRVIVVSDDRAVRQLFSVLLNAGGLTVVTSPRAADAWQQLQSTRFDLAIVDESLPDRPGLSLIEQIEASARQVPAVLVTGDPSVESVSLALEKGAVDYVARTRFDSSHVARRLRSVLDRRISSLLFEQVIRDLASRAGDDRDREGVAHLQKQLLLFKMEFAMRPHMLVYAADDSKIAALLERTKKTLLSTDNPRSAAKMVDRFKPLTAVVDLEAPGAVAIIKQMRSVDPQLEILAAAVQTSHDQALAAIEAGAADFVSIPIEGIEALRARRERMIARSRRRRHYLFLMVALYQLAKEIDDDVAEMIVACASAKDQVYIQRAPLLPHPNRETGEIDISTLA